MLKSEFQSKTSLTVEDKDFDIIHRIYMRSDDHQDGFCAAWRQTPESIRKAVVDEIDAIDLKADDDRAYRDKVRENVLKTLSDDPDSPCAYNLLDMRDIVIYKAKNGIDFAERDIEWMDSHLAK